MLFKNSVSFKEKALHWADANFSVFTFLENNNIEYPQSGFQNILAVGVHKICTFSEEEIYDENVLLSPTFASLLEFQQENKN